MLALLVHLLLHVNARPLWPGSPCELAAAALTNPVGADYVVTTSCPGSSPKEVKGRWPSAFG